MHLVRANSQLLSKKAICVATYVSGPYDPRHNGDPVASLLLACTHTACGIGVEWTPLDSSAWLTILTCRQWMQGREV